MKKKRTPAQQRADAKRTGRPTMHGKPMRTVLQIRVSDEEAKAIRAEAKRLGITVAALLLKPWRKES